MLPSWLRIGNGIALMAQKGMLRSYKSFSLFGTCITCALPGIRWTGIWLMRWCPTVNNDLEVLAAPALATQYETLVRVSRAIGAHRDLKELFGILMDELHGVVQFDLIGVSLRDQDSDAFQNYFIDITRRSEMVPDDRLTREERLTKPFS